eukprot:1161017-Pelagomonas_calceolata.AAC.3
MRPEVPQCCRTPQFMEVLKIKFSNCTNPFKMAQECLSQSASMSSSTYHHPVQHLHHLTSVLAKSYMSFCAMLPPLPQVDTMPPSCVMPPSSCVYACKIVQVFSRHAASISLCIVRVKPGEDPNSALQVCVHESAADGCLAASALASSLASGAFGATKGCNFGQGIPAKENTGSL